MKTKKELWGLIEKADWKSDHNYKRIKTLFTKELSHEDFIQLKEFVSTKRNELAKKFEQDWLADPGIEVSDDGWWDLTAEVVGRGEKFYKGITVKKLQKMARTMDYHENFEYSFQS